MIDIKNIKSTLIFLNEFYYLNGYSFQEFIDKIDEPKYTPYINKILEHKVFNNLFSLFGIYDKFYDNVVFTQSTRTIGIRNNNNSLSVYYNDLENTYNINIILPSLNSNYCHKMNWLVYIFKQIEGSQVISYYKTNNHFIVKIIINKIRIGHLPSSWQKVFKRFIFPSPGYDSRVRFFSPNKKYDFYLLDEILSSKWSANLDIIDIVNMSSKGNNLIMAIGENRIKKILGEWFDEVDWLRRREHVLAISRIKGDKKWLDVYFKLDRMLQLVVLDYL